MSHGFRRGVGFIQVAPNKARQTGQAVMPLHSQMLHLLAFLAERGRCTEDVEAT